MMLQVSRGRHTGEKQHKRPHLLNIINIIMAIVTIIIITTIMTII